MCDIGGTGPIEQAHLKVMGTYFSEIEDKPHEVDLVCMAGMFQVEVARMGRFVEGHFVKA